MNIVKRMLIALICYFVYSVCIHSILGYKIIDSIRVMVFTILFYVIYALSKNKINSSKVK